MRNIDCYKLTICPYTPEFNPVERFFNTIKRKAEDGCIRYTLNKITEMIV
jgi:transposase